MSRSSRGSLTRNSFTGKSKLNWIKHSRSPFGLLLLFALAASASAQTQPAVLDHFNCYVTPGQPLVPQFGWLQDQFDVRNRSTETIYDIRMSYFCNPAKKTVISSVVIPTVPIAHPEAHLAMYRITPQSTVIPRSVPINNQFGPQILVTGEVEFLAVPSGKAPISANGGPVTLPAIPEPGVLDHFTCYSASGASINRRVLLNDQFFTTSAEAAVVLTPRLFCNPVSKTVPPQTGCPVGQFCATVTTPIAHPTAHMACYLMSTTTPFAGVVAYNNQFVLPSTLPTVNLTNPSLLCVPSSKSEDWVAIPPNVLAP
jgi:hypothetical protein